MRRLQRSHKAAQAHGSASRDAWLDVDWQTHQRWLSVAGQTINAIELGSGPPVVLVHGHDGSWQSWIETLPHLAQRHRAVALDLPGFGSSPLPAGEISISRYVATLDALCETLELGEAAFVGSSMGGLLCAELAASHPQRVRRLVLVAAAGLSRRYMHFPMWLLANRLAPLGALNRASRAMGARARSLARRRRLRRAGLGASVRHPDRIAPELAALLIAAGGGPAGPAASAAILRHRLGERLAGVRCPTLIIWGEDDALLDVAAADEFERLIPAARKVILPDTGHLPMVEQPERFTALLDEFLG